jgi:DNA ligase (NAD+)
MNISPELQKKIDLLAQYDKSYYSDDESLIDDASYDLLKDSVLKSIPPSHPLFNKVGHKPSSAWNKEAHKIPMGSQSKVSSEDQIKDWVSKIQGKYGSDLKFVLQHKIDGFSLESIYEARNLSKAVTRGDGHTGENITANAKMFRLLPTVLPIEKDIVARGEGVLFPEDFDAIQAKENGRYKNPRNAASGISRRLDGRNAEFLRVITFDINAKVETELQKVAVIKKLGFYPVKTYECNSLDDILKIYREYKDGKREKLPYEIDGLVLKINDISKQEELGVTNNRPNGQVALKFDSDQALSELESISVSVGRTGKITPVGNIAPTELMGSTIRKLTLHNYSIIEELNLTEGAEIVIEKKGDIIPQIVEVVVPGTAPVVKPRVCPSCGGDLVDDGVNIWCYNDGCKERETNRITYWLKTLKIKGFSGKFIDKLWDKGLIRKVSDLYKLTPDDFVGMDGIGTKTIQSFFKTLKDTSEMYLEKFIVALGIPKTSEGTAKVLVKEYGVWDTIKSITVQDLLKLEGFQEVSASSTVSGIREISDLADSLLEVITIKEKKVGALTGKSFCVTGSLKSFNRNKFKEIVIDNGGETKNSVATGLDYLVTNDKDSGTSKNAKASKLGIPIINEEEFLAMAGFEVSEEDKDETPSKDSSGTVLEFEDIF